MPAEITMPQLSDTMTEGTIVKWNKKEGDKVKAGEEIAEVETDKATMPMEAFEGGVIAHVAAKEGDKVKVGGLIAVIATGSDKADEVKKKYASGGAGAAPAKAPTPAPAKAQVEVAAAGSPHGHSSKPAAQTAPNSQSYEGASSGEMHEPEECGHPAASHASAGVAAAVAEASTHGQRGEGNGNGNRLRISPLARRIAADNNVDVGQLTGTGPGGRIVQKDVLGFLEQGGAATPAKPAAQWPASGDKPSPELPPVVLTGQKRVVTMTKMRTAIATALQRSKQNVPHFYETIDIDMEELGKLRERINPRLEREKVRLSIMDFIYKAVASTLTKHPALNARFNAEKGEVTQYGDVNLGIAVAIPDGLIVPVLRGVNQMGLKDIRVRSTDLIDRARAQRLKREEQSEGTFTVSSLGTYGIREFSAIINPPEVGILAVGSAEQRAVVRDGQIAARSMMTVTLSADHRVVDGATAAEFLRTLKETLEDPGMMLV